MTWNLQWATHRSGRYELVSKHPAAVDADVAVLAETQVAVAEHHFAHQVNAGPHPASNKPYGSKVVLASKHPLAVVGLVGDPELPEANFVAVDVLLPDGNPLRVVGRGAGPVRGGVVVCRQRFGAWSGFQPAPDGGGAGEGLAARTLRPGAPLIGGWGPRHGWGIGGGSAHPAVDVPDAVGGAG